MNVGNPLIQTDAFLGEDLSINGMRSQLQSPKYYKNPAVSTLISPNVKIRDPAAKSLENKYTKSILN